MMPLITEPSDRECASALVAGLKPRDLVDYLEEVIGTIRTAAVRLEMLERRLAGDSQIPGESVPETLERKRLQYLLDIARVKALRFAQE